MGSALYSALPTMSSGMRERVTVRKQTVPQRVHSTTHMNAMRTYFNKSKRLKSVLIL